MSSNGIVIRENVAMVFTQIFLPQVIFQTNHKHHIHVHRPKAFYLQCNVMGDRQSSGIIQCSVYGYVLMLTCSSHGSQFILFNTD